jgi:dUTP pyrophosphatase
MRRFYLHEEWLDETINLPQRQTKKSAGYDFEAAEDVTIVPIWRAMIHNLTIKPQKVNTGISVKMNDDEVLKVYNRSSNPIKRLLLFATGTGIIDSDYEGQISFDFWNFGLQPLFIKKGERIGQGVFQKFLLTDDDKEPKRTRKGGNGSTDLDKN